LRKWFKSTYSASNVFRWGRGWYTDTLTQGVSIAPNLTILWQLNLVYMVLSGCEDVEKINRDDISFMIICFMLQNFIYNDRREERK